MRKAFIYLATASISFVVFYSIYYYSQFGRLGGGYNANADTLRMTLMQPHPYQPTSNKNIIFNAGMMGALLKANAPVQFGGMADINNILPSNSSIFYSGIFSAENSEKITGDLRNKFPNHPPLEFENIKEKQKLLMSYVFRNVQLPKGFTEPTDFLSFHGKKVKQLVFDPDALDETSKDSVWVFNQEKYFVLKARADNGDEVIWYNGDENDITTAYKNSTVVSSQEFLKSNRKYAFSFPYIDFYLQKTYTPNELEEYFSARLLYNHIENRLKLKTTGSKPLQPFADKSSVTKIAFNEKCFFFLKRKNAPFPYIGILLCNPEVCVIKLRE